MSATLAEHDEGSAQPLAGRAVFIDKDGTLVENVPYNVDPALLRFTPHAMDGLRLLAQQGYKLIVVTNQPGLAYGRFTRAALRQLHTALAGMMARDGVPLTDFFACPHAPGPAGRVPGCLCRKPAPGLLRQAARVHAIDLQRSWMIGDVLDDVEAGRRAGSRTVLLDVGTETVWRMSPLRTPHHRAANLLEAAQTILANDEPAGDDTLAASSPPDEPAAVKALVPPALLHARATRWAAWGRACFPRSAAPGRPKQGPPLAPDRPELVEGSPYSASGVLS
ncbi:D-glycero-alpha-D-manno-heptose-1,7-bisphosphate 7-phosphatase [Piscinibacter sp.]|uniref:D-glycero-alpha-D-manno-heptose-1,7-bisphosphate 7-phosphatase n=1 Tax=Piscinibacter sp. TaxID=1903157 RepID=UPI002BB5F01B|nr:HAD family hydrolase [Albitalea sp.]HUG25284.1 HAD family hydrolase [Albitalea sp.]